MSGDVIKQFLVGLGFQIDKKGQQEAEKSIGGVSAATIALGVEIAKTAESVVRGVAKMADGLDQLYFTSRRVNSSAQNVSAFGFAIQQLGGDASGASAALEGVASFMRSNPGGERFIAGLGVQTRQANGQLRDTGEIVSDLGKAFAAMPFPIAKVRAALLGIDEKTLLALEQGVDQQTSKYKEFARQLGLGMDGGTEAANRFGEKVRDLKAEFGLLFVAGASQVLPMLQGLADWLSRVLVDVAQGRGLVGGLTHALSDLGSALGSVVGAFGGSKSTFVDFGKYVVRFLTDEITGLAAALRVVADLMHGNFKGAWADANAFGAAMFRDDTKPGPGETSSAPVAGTLGASGSSSGILGKSDGSQPAPWAPRSVRSNNPGNLRDPRTGEYASFASAGQGADAMRRQIMRDYLVHGLRTVAQLINDRHWGWSNEWAKGNSHASTMNYIGSVARALGVSADAQVNFSDPAVLQRTMAAMARFESGGHYYDRPLMSDGGQMFASRGASVNQKTEIRVVGGADPAGTARRVEAAQERVNGNLVRNLKVAIS